MGLFKRKKPVIVKCYSKEELGKLINWMRTDRAMLSEMNRQHYNVKAVMTMSYWDNPDELMYFEVPVPYYQYKKLREQFIQRESFDPILQQQAFAVIMGRQL